MRSRTLVAVAAAALISGTLMAPGGADANRTRPPKILGTYKHLVVIYQENHSFDNLYGGWGQVHGRHVHGIGNATAAQTTQIAQDGSAYTCLRQVDVNLTSPPLSSTCSDPAHGTPASAFTNQPFTIDDYIAPTDRTCPAPGTSPINGVPKDRPGALPGGCTRDLVHRFYQEQYQLNEGQQNRYVTGSTAVGLAMGVYDTKELPIYEYLHSPGAPKYVVADRFFQGAFGGSFLNHQYLITGRAPIDTSGGVFGGAVHTVVDSNGMPKSAPQYIPTGPVVDEQLTVRCPDGNTANYELACGDFAVNTVQPASPPFGDGAKIPLIDDARYPNIGDRLSDAGVSWNWYSGGWDDAVAGQPGPLFQEHHQPFNYFAAYAPGQPGRAHLQDETDFVAAAQSGTLPTVSFVKPYGSENEHPGYASATDGSDHLVDLLETVMDGPQAGSTLVVVTYDEFGGQWDHVPPPGQGSTTPGAHDAFGPGTRVPALVMSRSLAHSGVDHTVYDTTSILATLERSFGLRPVGPRDTQVNDLRHALVTGGRKAGGG